MSDTAWRLTLVGSVTLGAVAVAWAASLRRWVDARAAASGPLDLSEVEGRVLLFSEASCRSCDTARARLEAAGVEYREVRYEEEPLVHRSAGVTAVPVIVVRTAGGAVVGRIAGKPSNRRLERLYQRAGIK